MSFMSNMHTRQANGGAEDLFKRGVARLAGVRAAGEGGRAQEKAGQCNCRALAGSQCSERGLELGGVANGQLEPAAPAALAQIDVAQVGQPCQQPQAAQLQLAVSQQGQLAQAGGGAQRRRQRDQAALREVEGVQGGQRCQRPPAGVGRRPPAERGVAAQGRAGQAAGGSGRWRS